MKRNRFGGIYLLAGVAGLALLLPAFGSADANAQTRRPDEQRQGETTRQADPQRQPDITRPGGAERISPTSIVPRNRPDVVTAPARSFTLATSVGTVDEDSAALVQLRNFTVTFLPAATGSVHVRYSLSPVNDISRMCPATQSVVRVRFRNTDNAGTTGKVSFEIHSTNITAGGNNILYTFSSNGRSAGGVFTTATDTVPIDFDFANNLYWIEATVFRSDVNALADLGSVQIWEDTGTPCP